MNYAKYKKQVKEQAKQVKIPAMLNIGGMTSQQVANHIGIAEKVAVLDAWYSAKESQIETALCKQFNDKLYDAENYIALLNVLISCIAIHMTWGYTKSIERFLRNLSPAKEYVQRNGLRKVLEQVNKEYNADLEFDTFDIIDFIKRCEEIDKQEEANG